MDLSGRYTGEQIKAINLIMRTLGSIADSLDSIAKAYDLDKVEGCNFTMQFEPSFTYVTKTITYGEVGSKAGYLKYYKGVNDNAYKADSISDSFGDVGVSDERCDGEGTDQGEAGEADVPTVGIHRDDPGDSAPVDCGVQMNDCLAER